MLPLGSEFGNSCVWKAYKGPLCLADGKGLIVFGMRIRDLRVWKADHGDFVLKAG